MAKIIKALFCSHKKIKYMYSENLSTECHVTTAEVDVFKCLRCGKVIIKEGDK